MRRTGVVVFGVLVAATFAAFFVAQRLKNAPSVVQQFNATYVFSPNRDGRKDRAHVTFKVKKADNVTVELVDHDGDPVKTLLDDRHLAAYAPISHGALGASRCGTSPAITGSSRGVRAKSTPHASGYGCRYSRRKRPVTRAS